VLSLPSPVPEEVKTLQTQPSSAPLTQRLSVWSRKLGILRSHVPKAPYRAKDDPIVLIEFSGRSDWCRLIDSRAVLEGDFLGHDLRDAFGSDFNVLDAASAFGNGVGNGLMWPYAE